jgi:hypothetical protein
MPGRRLTTVLVVLIAVVVAVLAGLRLSGRTREAQGARTPTPAIIDQTRADTLARVAKRIYFEEVFGSPDRSAFNVIGAEPELIAGLETGHLTLARRALNRVIVRHAVHERVVRGGRILADVGLKFVVAGQPRPLVAPDGTYLGQMEVSIQDVIGYIKLFHRLTGGEMVVRGSSGQAKSSLAAALALALPSSGPVVVGRRTYFVSSFRRAGFAGEPLEVWILAAAG